MSLQMVLLQRWQQAERLSAVSARKERSHSPEEQSKTRPAASQRSMLPMG